MDSAINTLIANGALYTQFSAEQLNAELNRWIWDRMAYIQVNTLWEYFCEYCYRPRLADYSVLEDAINQAAKSSEYFSVASGVEYAKGPIGPKTLTPKFINLLPSNAAIPICEDDYLVRQELAIQIISNLSKSTGL